MTEKISEKFIHRGFEKWMRERNIIFITCRMDRASTIAKGMPDYIVVHQGKCVFVEVKTDNGKLSPAQQDTIIRIKANQTPCVVARSVEECCEAVRYFLFEKEPRKPLVGPALDAMPYKATVEQETPVPVPVLKLEELISCYIATWGGIDHVFQRKVVGASCMNTMLRKATDYDKLHLPRI